MPGEWFEGEWIITIVERSVKRLAIISTVLLGFVLVGTPMGILQNASAADELSMDIDRFFVVGLTGMYISTLNVNAYTTAAETMVLFPCYSGLLQYSPDSELIGDVAYEWSSTPDGLTWYFKLHDNVYFCDPSEPDVIDESRHLTAQDVIWSLQMYNDNTESHLHTSLPGVISEIGMVDGDPFHVYITLNGPYAPFISAMTLPILPRYYWDGENPMTFDNSPPIGSGPFYYATDGIPAAGTAILKKNPIWFMTEERGWSPRVDTWILHQELNDGTAYVDLRDGVIDFWINVPAPAFIDLQETQYVEVYSQNAGFVYEFNLNQMTDEMRYSLGGAFRAGENNQLLLDPVVKNAIAMCVDKQGFVDETVLGLGEPADSLVPLASPWHYEYPDPIEFSTLAARDLLISAGWAYDITGIPAMPETVPLCKAGGTDPLSFRFCTLDSNPMWSVGAELIVNWCEEAGIELDLEVKSINEMNTIWYSADYDLWLWDWIFDPLGDPATDILSVLTTDAIGLNSDVYYSDPAFDALYQESLVTMDLDERAGIIDEMQAMAYEDMSCQCVAYRDDLYAASTRNWMNLGDLDSKYMMLPDVSNLWISLSMSPVDNEAPQIVAGTFDVWAEVGEPAELTVMAVDDDASTILECRWFWGDGEKSEWAVLGTGYGAATASHTYSEAGEYTVDFAVREASSSNYVEDFFVTTVECTVIACDMSNEAPVILGVECYPPDPDTATVVSFEAIAYDPEGDELEYTWDFGDGTGADGKEVTHTFPAADTYIVTVSVTDNIVGSGVRPVTASLLVSIALNHPPVLSVPDFGEIDSKTETVFSVVADDIDGDTLMFTWDWGDGTVTVTYEATATHSYRHGGTYVITVTVSDLTGLPGHEVSDMGTVYVTSGSKNQSGSGK